jgi:glycosyltransferase involved in cell wall biosynthesis
MKVLVAHWRSPEPDRNAGDLRLVEILRLLRELGHRVALIAPRAGSGEPPAFSRELEIPILLGLRQALRSPRRFALLLVRHGFEAAICSPYDVYQRIGPAIRRALPGCAGILDTIDLQHVRLARQARHTADPRDAALAARVTGEEWRCLRRCDAAWVVTEGERRRIGDAAPRVDVIPTIHRPAASCAGYGEREGIVFLGGYRHAPNVDAVHHFVRDVLPAVRAGLGPVPVTIAGSDPPDSFAALARECGIRVTGYVADHRALLGAARVGIAPLRVGAGMKGKIGEYLACGLPCVTTGVGAEGMALRDGRDALIADGAEAFARALIRVYRDRDLWRRLAAAGPLHVRRHLSPEVVRAPLADALTGAREMARRRNAARGSRRRVQRLRGLLRSLAAPGGSPG